MNGRMSIPPVMRVKETLKCSDCGMLSALLTWDMPRGIILFGGGLQGSCNNIAFPTIY